MRAQKRIMNNVNVRRGDGGESTRRSVRKAGFPTASAVATRSVEPA